MLNWNSILMYVKGRLGLPSTFIEKTDEEIREWIKLTTIPEFSNYFPDVETTSVLSSDDRYKVEGRTNHFRFFDDENLPIYAIKTCYFSMGTDFITGHPPYGSFTFEGMKWWALDVFKSRFFKPFSFWSKTYKFIPPNVVRVLPDADNENFVVEYEREQPPDLRRIPEPLKRLFMDLSLADVGILISSIRTHYGSMTTPFGEIPLKGDELKSEMIDLRREVMEKLGDESIPPIIIDIS